VFLARHDRVIEQVKRGIRNLVKLGNPRWNEYTPEEAARIVAAVKGYSTEVERAFRGTPREKGLFDL
jgi:hypothetical protein